MKTLRLVLGDQLSRDLPSLTDLDPDKDLVLMAEVMSEVTYVKHHKRKIAYLFSAMRHFAESLGKDGIAVRYRRLDDADNAGSLAGEVAAAIAVFAPDRIVVSAPGEYRLADEMAGWQARFGLAVDIRADTRFLCSLGDFAEWAEGRKSLRMEFFYRDLRRRYQVLMEGDEPIGGKWNYDADNRQPPKAGLAVPPPSSFAPDAITAEVLALVEARCADHFGQLAGFDFAVTRDQALHVLDQFIAERLPLFGTYQDAMIEGEPWMYHSHIGLYLNAGLLSPIEVIRVAEAAYHRGVALFSDEKRIEIKFKEDTEGTEHKKGFLTESFYFEGSMNFTYSGVFRNKEKITCNSIDYPEGKQKIANAYLEFERTWDHFLNEEGKD